MVLNQIDLSTSVLPLLSLSPFNTVQYVASLQCWSQNLQLYWMLKIIIYRILYRIAVVNRFWVAHSAD